VRLAAISEHAEKPVNARKQPATEIEQPHLNK
jgi:hypothetical protein